MPPAVAATCPNRTTRLPLNEFVVDGYNTLTCRYECDDCRYNTESKQEYKLHMADHPTSVITLETRGFLYSP